MGSMAKQKGKRGEREVVKIIQPIVDEVYGSFGMEPPQIFRNQNQSFQGGYDLDGLDWLAIEVKRQETLSIKKWWEQTLEQADKGQDPVLIYRQSRKKWRVMMYGWLDCGVSGIMVPVDIGLAEFESYLRLKLAGIIESEKKSK
ncbi:hypothetical protein KAR91_68265 [Candidatus Pacearchaeota archaeon]|nr:hypothetical protein [Candidatus Pacearchaeota archaeon]